MTEDVIVGARYDDKVYDDKLTVLDVEADDRSTDDPENITVVIEYDEGDEPIEVSLASFRQAGVELIEVPDDAG